ncbi:SDR family NAD(P)-dependent oxidoreductase [Glaciecola petra]|uniref:SDR family NAD(P)-dependent oxidoreductase n=1 Tax=Glaciecola petra TaxID=3075602 RepID=A0ABU2ZVM6_9ALTE|nr:SDR family NAD(P)-dependent oxidoreductase [Aestuariibacter sp. P117]MDT0596465.1 SDR family NAD(P)-dependent oxidoreductase [Aestuariibacter sp. P117]
MTINENKTVLVTGASSGLGSQFCRALSKDGYKVVAAARRLEKLRELCADINKHGGEAVPLELDVTDFESYSLAIDAAEAQVGMVHCLVNNAGSSISKKATEMTVKDFDFIMDLNLKAPYFLSTELARRWIANGVKGRIVNVGSVSDRKAMPGHTVYGTSKAAIARLSQQLAREWVNQGINVNTLAPGYIKTDLNEKYFDSPAGLDVINKLMPRKRIGTSEVLDKAIVYLCSPDQEYLTGQTLALEDGQTL